MSFLLIRHAELVSASRIINLGKESANPPTFPLYTPAEVGGWRIPPVQPPPPKGGYRVGGGGGMKKLSSSVTLLSSSSPSCFRETT